ncbi:hypothetical protein JXM67_05365 [candidate division WOR-3 bacterium]|nr:hypothetical protein [candidate division WOR-3 bacterium]
MLILLLLTGLDTISLPSKAAAISANQDGELVYITTTGDELFVEDDTTWQSFTLSGEFSMIEKLLVHDNLCYLLSNRDLTLCDLRTNRVSIIAQGADDAVINRYGELWVRSEYELKRVSPLGRLLEQETLSRIPRSIWMIGDSLMMIYESQALPLPGWLEELMSLDVFLPYVDTIYSLIQSSSYANLVITDKIVYILADFGHVIHLHQ